MATDMYYVEDIDLARQLVELGCEQSLSALGAMRAQEL